MGDNLNKIQKLYFIFLIMNFFQKILVPNFFICEFFFDFLKIIFLDVSCNGDHF